MEGWEEWRGKKGRGERAEGVVNAVVKTKTRGFLKEVRNHLGELLVCAIKRSENQNVYWNIFVDHLASVCYCLAARGELQREMLNETLYVRCKFMQTKVGIIRQDSVSMFLYIYGGHLTYVAPLSCSVFLKNPTMMPTMTIVIIYPFCSVFPSISHSFTRPLWNRMHSRKQ